MIHIYICSATSLILPILEFASAPVQWCIKSSESTFNGKQFHLSDSYLLFTGIVPEFSISKNNVPFLKTSVGL